MAHLERKERDRREEKGTEGQEGERILAHFSDLGRIWNREMETGGRRGGQCDRRKGNILAHFSDFE